MSAGISGLDTITALIDRIVIAADDSLREAAPIVVKGIQQNFDTKGKTTDAGEWPPVPVSALRKRQTWPSDPGSQAQYVANQFPLIDTGRLRSSFIYVSDETSDGDIEGEVYPDVDYAVDQERGVPGEIRQRSFMQVTQQVVSDVTASVERSMARWLE